MTRPTSTSTHMMVHLGRLARVTIAELGTLHGAMPLMGHSVSTAQQHVNVSRRTRLI